jgi:hypothetical protein
MNYITSLFLCHVRSTLHKREIRRCWFDQQFKTWETKYFSQKLPDEQKKQ